MDQVKRILTENNIRILNFDNINFIYVNNSDSGIDLAAKILNEVVSKKTALFLSGGRTPLELYRKLAIKEKINPGSVCLIDERYGDPGHDKSNEKAINDTGFYKYLYYRDIPNNKILKHSLSMRETAERYDEKLREIFSFYQMNIGILGIGLDGHTAGIPADASVWEEFNLEQKSKTEMVFGFDDHGKFYNKRITMSFLGLSMLDLYIVLVFGSDKRDPLIKMMQNGPEARVPSRFFRRPEVAKKTIIITDQEI